MHTSRHWRIRFTWLALAALLAAALMPSVSRALAYDRVRTIMAMEICAPGGKPAAGAKQGGGQDTVHLDECAYCRLQTDTPALPVPPPALPLATAAAPRPPLFYRSPTPLFAWAAAHPRGPPLLA